MRRSYVHLAQEQDRTRQTPWPQGPGLRKLFSPPMLEIKRGRAIKLRSPRQRSWTDGRRVHAPLGRWCPYARAVGESRI